MSSALFVRQAASTNSLLFPSARVLETPLVRVAVVTCDSQLRAWLADLLQKCSLKPEFASGFEELQSVCSKPEPIAALCGFQLADGTFHDVVEYFTARPSPIPVIMVSPPSVGEASPYFLESIKAGALGTICFPYRVNDARIMLWSAIQSQRQFQTI